MMVYHLNMEATTTNWTPIAITDECDTCGFCGKKGLNRTVVFESEAGEFMYLGCDCAAKLAARQGKKDHKAFTTARIARTLASFKSELALAQADLDKAVTARDAGQIHPQFHTLGVTWEQSITIRTANMQAVKSRYGIAA
jgi:hypothetical protein